MMRKVCKNLFWGLVVVLVVTGAGQVFAFTLAVLALLLMSLFGETVSFEWAAVTQVGKYVAGAILALGFVYGLGAAVVSVREESSA
jgi:hypothetical protein